MKILLNMNRFKCRLWPVNIGKFNLLLIHVSVACSKEWRRFAAWKDEQKGGEMDFPASEIRETRWLQKDEELSCKLFFSKSSMGYE